MLIIPAIDILDGKCVRLTKGVFGSEKIYSEDPFQVARVFESQGASMLHIVDLDGAKTGDPKNMELILRLCNSVQIPVQVGGGIRDMKTAQKYLSSGVRRIILGTKILEDFDFLKSLLGQYGPEKIVAGIDMRDGKMATDGWMKSSDLSPSDFFQTLCRCGVRHVVVTDISRDGMLTTPNFETISFVQQSGFQVVASGGISDIASLKKLKDMRVFGAILGKALYENKINLKDIFSVFRPISRLTGLTKRIIPCLDVADGRVVKGVNFENLRDAGDPVELARRYADEGADELVFLDIAASKENRETVFDMVSRVAREIFIPFTVGGGIQNTDQIRRLLQAGADKISLNTFAVLQPSLISDTARQFGSQCVVVAIDVKKGRNGYRVYIRGGSEETLFDAVSWAQRAEQFGAGEILLTSMDRDGTKQGFDLEILRKISDAVRIPVIASGGAGSLEDLKNAFLDGKADAVLAASLFHYREFSIKEAKKYLQSCNLPMRI